MESQFSSINEIVDHRLPSNLWPCPCLAAADMRNSAAEEGSLALKLACTSPFNLSRSSTSLLSPLPQGDINEQQGSEYGAVLTGIRSSRLTFSRRAVNGCRCLDRSRDG